MSNNDWVSLLHFLSPWYVKLTNNGSLKRIKSWSSLRSYMYVGNNLLSVVVLFGGYMVLFMPQLKKNCVDTIAAAVAPNAIFLVLIVFNEFLANQYMSKSLLYDSISSMQ